jgi:biotin carboxyl carrier protein
MSKKLVTIDGAPVEVDVQQSTVIQLGQGHYQVRTGNTVAEVFEQNGKLSNGNTLDGVSVSVESDRSRILRERFGGDKLGAGAAATAGSHIVKAPMPGLVRALSVSLGDIVTKNSTLLVLEAMKMENNINAAVGGRIEKIFIEAGTSVEKNTKLIEINTEA